MTTSAFALYVIRLVKLTPCDGKTKFRLPHMNPYLTYFSRLQLELLDVFTDVDTPQGSDAEGDPEEVQINIPGESRI